MGRCKDCRCYIVRCLRGDRCKRCARVMEEEKREMAELEVRLVEEQLATRREMQMTALEQNLLEAEVQQTAEETRRETEMTFLESIRRNEQRESEITNTVRCLREWGFTCEQALEYVRLISEENNYAGKTYNGEGWTEVARYLKQFGMTSEQTEQCRELSVKSLTENKKLDDVNEKLYESISYPVIAEDTTSKKDMTRPHDDIESTYERYADGSNGIHSCISAGQGSLCQQIMRQLQLGQKNCASNGEGKNKSGENEGKTEENACENVNTAGCNDVTPGIKKGTDKSIEALKSTSNMDDDDVSNAIFEEETTNNEDIVSHKPSIKEESMEAHESTPNMEDGRVDVSSAIFEEEDTNDGDFGHHRPSKTFQTQRRMTILYLRQWGFTSEEVAEYLRQTRGVSSSATNSMDRMSSCHIK